MTRTGYPSDEDWAFAAPYLTLKKEDAPHDLRVLLRLAEGKEAQPSAVIVDGMTMQSTPESGGRAGYDGYKRKNGSKIHMAVDTLGLLLALHVTPADEQERDQIGKLAEEVQAVCHKKICQGLLRRSRLYKGLSCSGGRSTAETMGC